MDEIPFLKNSDDKRLGINTPKHQSRKRLQAVHCSSIILK